MGIDGRFGGTGSRLRRYVAGDEVASAAVRVGIVQLVEHPALDAAAQGMTDALNQAFPGRKIEILHRNAQGDQGNLQSIAQSYVSGGVQLIGAVSTPAAQAMANRTTEIPIVGTAISDYVAAKRAQHETPGTNVTGTTDRTSEQLQVELLQALFLQAKRIGVLYTAAKSTANYRWKASAPQAKRRDLL